MQNYSYGVKDLAPGERLLPNGSIVVRKDLWEAIGSPDMTTPEGFLAACDKVKKEIGKYNGQDIIPLQLYENVGNSMLWLSQFFHTPYEDANGNWVYDWEQPNYKDSLKFLNDAYNRGLILDANFSDTRDLVNEKIASGRVFAAVVAAQDFFPQFQALYDTDNKAVYMPVALHNYNAEEPVLQDIRGFGWLNTAITTKAEHPERIIQLFQYLLSEEGQRDAAYGIEGQTYEFVDNGTKIKMLDTPGDPKDYAFGAMMMLDNWALRRKWAVPPTDPKAIATSEDTLKAGLDKYTYDFNAAALKIDPTDPDLNKINDIKIKMNELRKRYIAQIIIAPTPEKFESLYQEALKELDALGLPEVKEFNNKYFQAAKKALGIERSYATRNDK
jgi:putative aldouronate transport system substrate-binding protein